MGAEKSFDKAWSLVLGTGLSLVTALMFLSRAGYFPFVSEKVFGAEPQVNAAYFAALIGSWVLFALGALAFRYVKEVPATMPDYDPPWPRFTAVEQEGARDPHIARSIFFGAVGLLVLGTVFSAVHYAHHSDLYDDNNIRLKWSADAKKEFLDQRLAFFFKKKVEPVRIKECKPSAPSGPCVPLQYTHITDVVWIAPLLLAVFYWIRWIRRVRRQQRKI